MSLDFLLDVAELRPYEAVEAAKTIEAARLLRK